MVMGRPKAALVLSPEQRRQLEGMASSRSLPAGLVTRVRDWPFSSFHRMVKLGAYPEDWAGDVAGYDGEFGERR